MFEWLGVFDCSKTQRREKGRQDFTFLFVTFFLRDTGTSRSWKRINTRASSSKTNNEYDSRGHIIKGYTWTYAFRPGIPHSHKQRHFPDWGELGNGIEKNQEASFCGYTTILRQLCLWVKGHAGFSIANVFSTAFVTDPASVSNYAHKSKAEAVAAALYLRWRFTCQSTLHIPMKPVEWTLQPVQAQSENT